jgi:hypothetical protein
MKAPTESRLNSTNYEVHPHRNEANQAMERISRLRDRSSCTR